MNKNNWIIKKVGNTIDWQSVFMIAVFLVLGVVGVHYAPVFLFMSGIALGFALALAFILLTPLIETKEKEHGTR